MESQITEQSKNRKRPVKPFHNVRAHSNPLADKWFENTPTKPADFDWKSFYPEAFESNEKNGVIPKVEMADIGCGFGGLLCRFTVDL